jgi:SAM-dependent methyltransferase
MPDDENRIASSSRDAGTLRFYSEEAARLAARPLPARPWGHIEVFLKRLPQGAAILDLGCGAGRDSAFFIEKGSVPFPVDGSPAMAALAARRLGRLVPVMEFSDIAFDAAFDGIWAQASLQHVPRPALPGILGRLHRALLPGGILYASFRAGAGEHRDLFGRYYNMPDEEFLRAAIRESGAWQDILLLSRRAPADDGVITEWLIAFAQRSPDGNILA